MPTMTYEQWWSRGPAVCDAECAGAMGYECFGHSSEERSGWRTPDGHIVIDPSDPDAWSPTTDRNVAAIMVERAEALGRFRWWAVLEQLWRTSREPKTLVAFALTCDPSLLAYCAWRALKEEA